MFFVYTNCPPICNIIYVAAVKVKKKQIRLQCGSDVTYGDWDISFFSASSPPLKMAVIQPLKFLFLWKKSDASKRGGKGVSREA